jgi:DNA polymerase III epsilon subunit-like protein
MTSVYVDTETSGIDPTRHAVIEVGAIVVSPDGQAIARYSALANPGEQALVNSDPRAFEVNGIDLAAVRSAKPSADVAAEFRAWLDTYEAMLHAFPNSFEQGFLMRGPWIITRPWGPCIMTLAQEEMGRAGVLPLVYGKPKYPKLIEAAAFYKVPVPRSHRALPDAVTTARIHRAILGRRKTEVAEDEARQTLEDTA